MRLEVKFKISIIMPVYNVEEYLEEAILSIIHQTIDFEKNIQLIIVNDGSPDNSEKICLDYAARYPENIVYLKQENSGVSAARNYALEHAQGHYIGFLDPDDLWDHDAVEKGVGFLDRYYDMIDVVGFRIHMFEAVDDYHVLDYKFSGNTDKIIDIHRSFDHIQLSTASSFFKASVLKGYRFDTTIKIGEDVKFIYPIVLKKQRLGLISTSCYQYRKRLAGDSALQASAAAKTFYNKMLDDVHQFLIQYSLDRYGYVLPYVQYYLAYELKYRIRIAKYPDSLGKEEQEQHEQKIYDILQYVDDRVIGSLRNTTNNEKLSLLHYKYKKPLKELLRIENRNLWLGNLLISRLWKRAVRIDILEEKDGNLHIEGFLSEYSYLDENNTNLYFEDQKSNRYPVYLVVRPDGHVFSLGHKICEHKEFCCDIPLKGVKELKLMLSAGEEAVNLLLGFSIFGKLTEKARFSYTETDHYVIKSRKKSLMVFKKSVSRIAKSELRFGMELLKNKNFKPMFLRWLYYIIRIFTRKKVWLISDRITNAKDNGAAFYRYAVKRCPQDGITPYFVLSKTSPEYQEMKRVGKVIPYGSLKYKLYFLLSDKIISSSGDAWVLNPFELEQHFYRGLYSFDYVFLQHGIIKDDLSGWLHKYNKNIKMFVTSAKAEYDSIVQGNYHYTKDDVALTGLPRYDYLTNRTQKKTILILPTWRKNLVGAVAEDGTRIYSPSFKKSLYFTSYDSLIRDPKFLEALETYGFDAKFYLHPSLLSQINDFEGNDNVRVIGEYCDYNKQICEATIMITDFSSVAFDFAYLRKPVLYYQFDADTIFDNHIYQRGYFEYERDGLGPVCPDCDTLVDQVIKVMENDGKPQQEYLDRIEKFYYKFDKNNSERVYDKILEIR